MSIALAGAGCALAILGVLIVSGDTGAGDDDFNRAPGIILCALVIAGGHAALARVERGAVATAGTVAAALGVPPLLFFMTFDENGIPPYSTEAILVVSTIAWLVSYAVGPGRGRLFFLGAGLFGVWASVLQLTEDLFDAPYLLLGLFFPFVYVEPSFDDSGSLGGESDFGADLSSLGVPDPTAIGILSLAFGVAYVVLSRRFDRQGHHGAATPFTVIALPAFLVGVIGMADELEQAGSGLLAVGIGVGLAYHGSSTWRRATTWIGGAATVVGAGVFLGDMTDEATLLGLLYVAAGIGIVFAGHAIAQATGEADELAVTVPVAPADDSVWAPPPPPDLPPPPQP